MNPTAKKAFATEFYSRQTIMKELGTEGQKKLANSTVTIVGIGGLGTVTAQYLALAGVGKLRLIDQDTVETHNLHRQVLYTKRDLHYPKAEIAAKKLKQLNPLIKTEAITQNLNPTNTEKLLSSSNIIADGLDNMQTRYLVNRATTKLRIPYVFGAAIGVEGNISVFHPPDTPCLECILPNIADDDLQNCNTRGVIGATPGIIGAIQAMETIKTLTGIGTTLKNKFMVCDFNDMTFTTIDITKRKNCPNCQNTATQPQQTEKLVWLCGKNTANVNPQKPLNLNLTQLQPTIQKHFNIRLKTRLATIFQYKNMEISLFTDGRMLIKNVPNEQAALTAHREILKKIT